MRKLLGVAALAGLLGTWALGEMPAWSQEKKIRVIIIDGQNNHNWRATTPHLKKILEDSGRFVVDVSSNLKQGDKPGEVPTVPFPPDLSKYDVLLSNYNGAMWPEAFNKMLDEQLSAGKIQYFPIWSAGSQLI
jgi:hypothetical protein